MVGMRNRGFRRSSPDGRSHPHAREAVARSRALPSHGPRHARLYTDRRFPPTADGRAGFVALKERQQSDPLGAGSVLARLPSDCATSAGCPPFNHVTPGGKQAVEAEAARNYDISTEA